MSGPLPPLPLRLDGVYIGAITIKLTLLNFSL